MNILIIGADGFIGEKLSKYLEKKHNIFNLVLNIKDPNIKNPIVIDLTNPSYVKLFFDKFKREYRIDVIVHLAAKLASVDNTYDIDTLYSNLRITESIVKIARLLKPKKIINFSSNAVYPNKDGVYAERSETRPSMNSDCLYGLSKFCSENILDFMLKDEKIVISHLRISQVYGVGMREDRTIPVMLKELKEKNTITVFGGGERISNFIQIEKLIKLVGHFFQKDTGGIYNIGDENMSYLNLAQRLIEQHGNKCSKIIKDSKGPRTKFYLDTTKINKLMNAERMQNFARPKMKKVYVIAEAGVNHNGSIETAKKMIDKAVEAGVDAIKFQTFKAEKVISKFAPKAEYQQETANKEESQLEMAKKLELDIAVHEELIEYCKKRDITFLSSPFDLESIDLLHRLGIEIFKIPSGEITNLLYLRKIGSLGKKIIMSTGMADLKDIKNALEILIKNGTSKDNIIILHCNTEYPTPFEDANLSAMLTIKEKLDIDIGYSDHTLGIEVSIAAVTLGATVLEKHFTLDRSMEGPDHKASLEPDELKAMVQAIRNIEKAFGNGIKKPSPSELKNKKVVRKSIIAARDIKNGEVFLEDNLTVKRPGTGLSPMEWDKVIGRKAKRDFKEDELIET